MGCPCPEVADLARDRVERPLPVLAHVAEAVRSVGSTAGSSLVLVERPVVQIVQPRVDHDHVGGLNLLARRGCALQISQERLGRLALPCARHHRLGQVDKRHRGSRDLPQGARVAAHEGPTAPAMSPGGPGVAEGDHGLPRRRGRRPPRWSRSSSTTVGLTSRCSAEVWLPWRSTRRRHTRSTRSQSGPRSQSQQCKGACSRSLLAEPDGAEHLLEVLELIRLVHSDGVAQPDEDGLVPSVHDGDAQDDVRLQPEAVGCRHALLLTAQ